MTEDEMRETCAKACHEMNRVYCESQGDFSQKSWEEAVEWQRVSARNGVTNVLNGVMGDALHEAWRQEKIADGWTWAEEKNAEKKQHPCLVPWAQLPMAQKVKDHVFVNTVNLMMSSLRNVANAR